MFLPFINMISCYLCIVAAEHHHFLPVTDQNVPVLSYSYIIIVLLYFNKILEYYRSHLADVVTFHKCKLLLKIPGLQDADHLLHSRISIMFLLYNKVIFFHLKRNEFHTAYIPCGFFCSNAKICLALADTCCYRHMGCRQMFITGNRFCNPFLDKYNNLPCKSRIFYAAVYGLALLNFYTHYTTSHTFVCKLFIFHYVLVHFISLRSSFVPLRFTMLYN